MTVAAAAAAAREDSAHGGSIMMKDFSHSDGLSAECSNGTVPLPPLPPGREPLAVSASAAAALCGPRPEEPPLQPGTEEYLRHLPVTETHALDVGTKDDWVHR